LNHAQQLRKWPDERLRRLTELWPDPRYSVLAIARELEAVRRRTKFLALEGRQTSGLSFWIASRRRLLRNIDWATSPTRFCTSAFLGLSVVGPRLVMQPGRNAKIRIRRTGRPVAGMR
jgi:hypothetical protein